MGSLLGILLHALGGFASGSFYLPFRKVRGWAWESAWLAGGLASWIIVPAVAAALTIPGIIGILTGTDSETLAWTYTFGALWGIGGLTFGLTMRYLGISLGMAVALGLCAAFGTLIPPIWQGQWGELVSSPKGRTLLSGVAVCLAGIAICGWAGVQKEADLSPAQRTASVAEHNLRLGLLVATISGILSACFAFALAAGQPIAQAAVAAGAHPLWQNNAIYPVLLLGGFTTNAIWCAILHRRNRSAGDYTNPQTPLLRNYGWAFLAGTTWYLQFFFYGMGDAYLGPDYRFAGWTLHMAFIILFSSAWGLLLGEWLGCRPRTYALLVLGLLTILASTILIGLGNT